MVDKNKVLYINGAFTKKALPSATETIESIFIEGYASTVDVDRGGDVVSASAWAKGMDNYLKNPIILAQHDYDDPIGRMIEHRIDAKGLWVKARISAAAEVFNLIKDEVLTAFSIGFRILDAEYNAAAEVFLITDLELVEISVVSVPMNQNALFNLSKAFDSAEDYNSFKAQFIPKGDSAKGLESLVDKASIIKKEWNMDPKELQLMLDNAAKAAAEQATKSLLATQAAEKAAAEASANAAADMDARIKAAVALATPASTGTEKLLADIEKRFADQATESKSAIAGLEAVLAEKAAEITAMQKSKMSFSDPKGIEYAEREKAVLLAKVKGVSIEGTAFGKELMTKAGAHVPGAIPWEQEVSLTMENEIRRRLVIAGLNTPIQMKTNVMTMPVNPEAGVATWITNAQFGTAASAGTTQTHQLKEITLNAYKVATNEYMAYEEDEDSLIALMPIVRDAMIRRVAKAVDKAFLLGAGAGADPVKGYLTYDATSAVTSSVANKLTIANLRALRADMGVWGLTQSDLVFVVSTDGYYDLLEDVTFQTMDKAGPSATIITGQIGMIGQTPVLVSDGFPAKIAGTNTATNNYGAMCLNVQNFISGSQRGLRMDTQELVETQRRVIVASLRTGMTQLSSVNGLGVSAFRWVA
jgi:HK97 family phage prohead protease/HK97 family phage major capsid protein